MAIAESCTGGLLAAEMTSEPGSSAYFRGGITSYSNDLKEKWLEVRPDILQKKGAVSPEIALQMAGQVRIKMNASIGIGITGIAGPSGGTRQKPVGLVYLAIVSSGKRKVWKEVFSGFRAQIQARAVKKALQHLLYF